MFYIICDISVSTPMPKQYHISGMHSIIELNYLSMHQESEPEVGHSTKLVVLTCLPAKNNLWFSGLMLNFSSTSFLNSLSTVVLDVGIVTDKPVSIILTWTYMINRLTTAVSAIRRLIFSF